MRKSFTFRGIWVLFAKDWWRSRERPCFWVGIPATVAGAGLLVLLAFAQLESPEDRGLAYLMAARRAYFTGNTETAEIFYKKSLNECPNDRTALLEAAALADEREDYTRRDAIVGRLVEQDGDPIAMLYQGLIALREMGDEHALNKAHAGLERALASAEETTRRSRAFLSKADDLRRALANAETRRGKLDVAVEHLQALEEPSWEDQALTVETLLVLRESDATHAMVEQLARALPGPTGDEALWHRRSAVLAALRGDEQNVLGELILAHRFRAHGERSDKSLLWAQTAVRTFRLLRLTAETFPSLRSLNLALVVTPSLPSLAAELLALAGMDSGTGAEPIEASILIDFLARGDLPVPAHLIAGLADLREGKKEGAELHFSIAKVFYPAAGLVLTQCGLQLARLGEGYGVLAMELGETGAAMMDGESLSARLGHGHILLTLQKWQEAVEWLAPLREEHEEIVGPLLKAAEEKLKTG